MKKAGLVLIGILICGMAYGAVISTYTEIEVNSLHGNILRANDQVNPTDGLYYPLPIQVQGSSTSDTGIRNSETVFAFFGTPQAEKFETALELYQALPDFIKPYYKDLGIALIDVDLSE